MFSKAIGLFNLRLVRLFSRPGGSSSLTLCCVVRSWLYRLLNASNVSWYDSCAIKCARYSKVIEVLPLLVVDKLKLSFTAPATTGTGVFCGRLLSLWSELSESSHSSLFSSSKYYSSFVNNVYFLSLY